MRNYEDISYEEAITKLSECGLSGAYYTDSEPYFFLIKAICDYQYNRGYDAARLGEQ